MECVTVRIHPKTKERLDKPKATYDQIMNKALDALEGKIKK
jgi:hypothetical protein